MNTDADLKKLICTCGHSAHWHGARVQGTGQLVQGAGRCDDCDCSHFTQDDRKERIAAPHGRCPHCGAPNQPFTEECRHRRACEARQMLKAGESVEKAAAHAQRLSR